MSKDVKEFKELPVKVQVVQQPVTAVEQRKIEVIQIHPSEVFQWTQPAWGWLFLGIVTGFLLQSLFRWKS